MAARRPRRPRTSRQRATRARALGAIGDLRRGTFRSLSAAAREHHTSTRTIRTYVPGAIERPAGSRRWRAKPGDTYGSALRVIAAGRRRPEVLLEVRGSRQRSLIGRHRGAVANFLNTGNESVLDPFRGVTIRGRVIEPSAPDDGEVIEVDLLTDVSDLQAHGDRGELSDEGPYVDL